MDYRMIVESYINDVAALLPRRLRNDVGLELRTLLVEQVQGVAEQAGREPDRAITLEVLRRFGTPAQIADRYRPRGFQIIDPEHAPTFVKLAVAFVALQWLVTFPAVFNGHASLPGWWVGPGLGALWWIGVLTLWFGAAGWLRRRLLAHSESDDTLPAPGSPRTASKWQPTDRGARARRSAILLLPPGVAVITFLSAPTWFLMRLMPDGDAQWAAYDPVFARRLLPTLIVLMVLRLVLFATVLMRRNWWLRTQALRFGLRVCFLASLYWVLLDWTVFENAAANILFKVWLWIFAVVSTVSSVMWITHNATRVRAPVTP